MSNAEQTLMISVVGGGDCTQEEARIAEQVGAGLAMRGAILVCGGLGGIMEAACRGAAGKGGLTLGILPRDNRFEANPYVKVPIATGLGNARNYIVARSADAVIAIGGNFGTLTEIAYALQAGTQVIGIGTWTISRGDIAENLIEKVSDPIEAVEKAIAAARKRIYRK